MSRRSDRPTPPLAPELLRDIAAGIGASSLWQGVVRHDEDERRPALLLATDAYEVWVIGWRRGQRAPLHDHGPAAGTLLVVEGDLTEVTVTADGVRTEALPSGTMRDLVVGLVHEVLNEQDAPATSIHVYSPPLRTMTRYDDTLAPTVTEILPVEEPTFAVPADRLLHHPSVG